MIASPSNPRIKAAARLRDRRRRDETGLTLVDGARELRRALDAGVDVVEAFVCEPLLAGEDARAVLDALAAQAIPTTSATEVAFGKIAFGDRADGLVGVVRIPSMRLDDLAVPDEPLIVVVEGVEKPGNLGAVLRSADGAGVDALIAASPKTDLMNPNAIRASAGTIFSVPLASAPTEEVLDWLRGRSIRIVAALVDAEPLYTDADLTGPLAIGFGSEAAGLTDAVANARDRWPASADARDRRQPQRVGLRGGGAVRGETATRPSAPHGRLTRWTRPST